jgi:NitT/TauT family transport system substrate-binding protein
MNRPDADGGDSRCAGEHIAPRVAAKDRVDCRSGGTWRGIVWPCRTACPPADDAKFKQLKLSWNAGAICTAPVPVADKQGFFAKRGLDVELINFAGSTDQLLEAIATGKSDAGIGMALRWIKPLEQGFDVKLTAGIHGGCMRLLATRSSGIVDVQGLRGKIIGVSDMASPTKNFFAIVLKKLGIDPDSEVQWRQYPANLLGEALKKGEVHAVADGDPTIWMLRESDHLYEVSNNLCGEYQTRCAVCSACVARW